MTKDVWNPEQYERFRSERSQPFYDLMALVRPRPGMRVVDLGCGTGDLTRVLHDHLNAAETVGIDNSGAMLEKARIFAGGGLRFEKLDINDFSAERAFDLVFSNAALHWITDHEAYLERLTRALAGGGQLAVQVPRNGAHPSHVVAAEIAAEPPFREALGGYVFHSPVLEPEAYAELLDRLGYREQHVRLQVYGYHLRSREEVVEWVKGTMLTRYQKLLPGELYEEFLARYRERLMPRLSAAEPVFSTYNRLLFWASR